MYWRLIREADLVRCLEIQPACIGDQLVDRATALTVWKALFNDPSFNAVVIESETPIAGHRIVGCGMGVFVSSKFADREIADPRAGLNSRIIAGVASGERIMLSHAEIGMGNAGKGVD